MNYPLGRPYAETHSLPPCHHFKPWPIRAGKLVSLIDLGWSDYRIACYFCVDPEGIGPSRVLRIGWPCPESWVSRNETAASLGKRGMNIIVAR